MQRISIKTAITVFLVSMVAACAKETAPAITPDNGEKVEGDDKIEVAIDGIIDGFVPSDESKASAENVIRIMWQGGETVYVYDGRAYLGPLTASVPGADATRATLSGTITAPSGEKSVTLVYSPEFSDRPDLDGRISLDISAQSSKDVPFMIYSVMDSLEGATAGEGSEVSGKTVTFKLATSVYKCNCADLSQEGTISNVSLEKVNTKCVIALSDDAEPAIGGSDRGTITRSAGLTAADSRLIFSVSMAPDSEQNSSRRIIVTKGGFDYDSLFPEADLEAAKAYNNVFVFKPTGAIPGKFSVNSSGKKVYFATGNMWHGDDGYHIENNQWERKPLKDSSWVNNHISHFYWSKQEWYSRQALYNDLGKSASDVFFSNKTETTPNPAFGVIVSGKEQRGVWRTLSDMEWQYLFNKRTMTFAKPRYTNRFAGVKIEGLTYRGLFIYPDDYNLNEVADREYTWAQINAAGIVFLPAVGIRQGTEVTGVVTNQEGLGWYWSATADDGDSSEAYSVYFAAEGITFDDSSRGMAHSVRLVRDYK